MSVFKFKYFDVLQSDVLQKVGTDAMVLGALVEAENPKHILEVGMGTGVIALMLAQVFENSQITALDVDEKAIQISETNFRNSPFKNRLSVVHENFLSYSKNSFFDLIVSNPPYFNTQMLSEDAQRNLARHEGNMSVKDLIVHANSLLTMSGKLALILPAERTIDLLNMEKDFQLHLLKRIKIYGKPDKHVRDVLFFSKNEKKQLSTETFVIRDEKGFYSTQYKEKTREFHCREV